MVFQRRMAEIVGLMLLRTLRPLLLLMVAMLVVELALPETPQARVALPQSGRPFLTVALARPMVELDLVEVAAAEPVLVVQAAMLPLQGPLAVQVACQMAAPGPMAWIRIVLAVLLPVGRVVDRGLASLETVLMAR